MDLTPDSLARRGLSIFDAAKYLKTDADVVVFLDAAFDAVVEDEDRGAFMHALNTAARARGSESLAALAGELGEKLRQRDDGDRRARQALTMLEDYLRGV